MGILDGGIARLFNGVFSGIYLDGSAHVGTAGPIYDGARITGYSTGTVGIKVQTDQTSQTLKATPGYAEGDVLLIILALDTDGDAVELNADSQVTDGYGDRYRILDTEADAARSHWVCHARPV